MLMNHPYRWEVSYESLSDDDEVSTRVEKVDGGGCLNKCLIYIKLVSAECCHVFVCIAMHPIFVIKIAFVIITLYCHFHFSLFHFTMLWLCIVMCSTLR